MYKRKTKDWYYLEGDYGNGFEHLTGSETMKEARQDRRDYMENDNQVLKLRIVKRREKIVKIGGGKNAI